MLLQSQYCIMALGTRKIVTPITNLHYGFSEHQIVVDVFFFFTSLLIVFCFSVGKKGERVKKKSKNKTLTYAIHYFRLKISQCTHDLLTFGIYTQ